VENTTFGKEYYNGVRMTMEEYLELPHLDDFPTNSSNRAVGKRYRLFSKEIVDFYNSVEQSEHNFLLPTIIVAEDLTPKAETVEIKDESEFDIKIDSYQLK